MSPDGDCIGSCLGLYNYIADNYPDKEVDIFLEPIPSKFSFLRYSDRIKQEKEKGKVYDLYFSMDCSDPDRLRDFRPWFEEALCRICIDHHMTNEGFGDKAVIFRMPPRHPRFSGICWIMTGYPKSVPKPFIQGWFMIPVSSATAIPAAR